MRAFLITVSCFLSFTVLAETPAPSCVEYISAEKYSGTIPKNFTLVPPCPNALGPDGFASDDFFVGVAEISGRVYYNEKKMDFPMFEADKKSGALLPSWTSEFKLSGIHVPHLSDFHFPKIEGCWFAPATILVKQINLVNDGSDNSGSYLKEYKVLSLGKYDQCRDEVR